jgi:hypothetical protein
MSDAEQMNRIIGCWALAEKRAKHLCAFETLDLSFRLKKPTREEVKKAWYRLAMRLHPDKNSDSALATEATRCINLAKQYLFEEHFGDAASRVMHKHTWREAAAEKAAAEKAAAEKAAAEKESADKPAATEETAAPLAVEPTQAAAQPTEQHAAETVAQQLAELPARAAAEQASPQRTGPTEQTSKRPRSESPAPDGERPASAQQHEEEVKRQQCSASSAACSAEVCS